MNSQPVELFPAVLIQSKAVCG